MRLGIIISLVFIIGKISVFAGIFAGRVIGTVGAERIFRNAFPGLVSLFISRQHIEFQGGFPSIISSGNTERSEFRKCAVNIPVGADM